MLKSLAAAAAAVCAMLSAGQAQAAVMWVHATGYVSAAPVSHPWGPQWPAVGDPFTFDLKYDTAQCAVFFGVACEGGNSASSGNGNPVLSAQLSMGAITVSNTGQTYDLLRPGRYNIEDPDGIRIVLPVAPGLDLFTPYVAEGVGSGYYQVSSDFVTLVTQRIAVTAVPEPATWAMMILGFVSAGIALRRKSGLAPG